MNSVFIKSGNQIFNREHVCGVQYNTIETLRFNDVHHSKLSVFTVDGKEIIFYDRNADILWEVLSDSSLDLTPNPVVENK